MDEGASRIRDRAELQQVRRQAAKVFVKSAAVALLMALVSLALP